MCNLRGQTSKCIGRTIHNNKYRLLWKSQTGNRKLENKTEEN